MHPFLHEQLAMERHREAYLEARRLRLQRAVRAANRARRAAEIAVRIAERAGLDGTRQHEVGGRRHALLAP